MYKLTEPSECKSSTFLRIGYNNTLTKNLTFLLDPITFKNLTKTQLLSKIKAYNLWS